MADEVDEAGEVIDAGAERIDRLWPDAADGLDDEELLAEYAMPIGRGDDARAQTWLRMNFVSSVDGAVTRGGVAGDLGGPGDERVFKLLRRQADVVLLGVGTARAEGYGAMVLDADAEDWRLARGLTAQPVCALVSGALDLDPGSELFRGAPVRPIVYTVAETASTPGGEQRRAGLDEVADVVVAGETELDAVMMKRDLGERGLHRVHSEGGPTLFGSLVAVPGMVDELCLTLAATLEAGNAGRIAHSAAAVPTGMELASVLRSGDELLLRYRAVGTDAGDAGGADAVGG